MRWLAMALISVACAAAPLNCRAESECAPASVRSSVEVEGEQLTLAELLEPDTCSWWRGLATRMSLGAVPRAGSERVFEGREIRRLLSTLENRISSSAGGGRRVPEQVVPEHIVPERIVVRRAGLSKTCADIAEFVRSESPSLLNCAAAPSVPKDAPLELLRTSWNSPLQRTEYALRCVRADDCVPFLVWAGERKTSAILATTAVSKPPDPSNANEGRMARLVKPGQTAILSWEHAGIRVVLPVTCLEAGGFGQFVRVRFQNASRTLRAVVVGAAMLRANL